jgi:hypothetical protein
MIAEDGGRLVWVLVVGRGVGVKLGGVLVEQIGVLVPIGTKLTRMQF